MTPVWLHATDEVQAATRDEVRRALQDCGVEPCALDLDHPGAAGVVLFDDVSAGLCELIRDANGGGRARIIAVAVNGGSRRATDPWSVLAAGADDVLEWTRSPTTAPAIAARLERWATIEEIVASPAIAGRLVGESTCWRTAMRQVVEAALFTTAPVIVTGETGTGKELVARVLHEFDARPQKRELVLLDCTTIVPTLSGSEFFGHERGAFTGAMNAREGAFALADDGTLFLDEVGELQLALQAELLRVVQEGTYRRVGSNVWRQTRFRLICATHRNLAERAEHEDFRWDFYYRIAGVTIRLPSLRERPDDILPLARHFLAERSGERRCPGLDPAVRNFLAARAYPGNVRDLRHLVSRIALRHVGPGPITLGDIPEDERATAGPSVEDWPDERMDACIRHALARGMTLSGIRSVASDVAVRLAIAEEDGSLQGAARRLDVTPRALQLRRAARRPVPPFEER